MSRTFMRRHVIGKRFKFEAAHQLHGLPEGHKCGRMHGHSYTVEVTVTAEELDEHGFIVDFAELKPFRAYVDTELDHQVLNDVIKAQPTAENIAAHLADWFQENLSEPLGVKLVAVRVWETATSFAECRLSS